MKLKLVNRMVRRIAAYYRQIFRRPIYLWLALLGAAVIYHLGLLVSTSAPIDLILFTFVLWAVAWLPIEDLLPSLEYKPGYGRVFVLSVVWIAILIRGWMVQSYADPYVAVFPVAALFSLVFLFLGRSGCIRFSECFAILGLMPVLAWLPRLIPTAELSESAAAFAGFVLRSFGADIIQNGHQITIGVATVNVAGPCSGNEIMVQALVVALLAFIVFPMPIRWMRFPFLLVAPLFGWFANGLRVALLALLASFDPVSSVEDSGLFGFFHLGEGGMVFSSLGIALYAFFYVKTLDRQLAASSRYPDSN